MIALFTRGFILVTVLAVLIMIVSLPTFAYRSEEVVYIDTKHSYGNDNINDI